MPRGVQIKTNYDIMISNRSYRDLDRPVKVPTGTRPDRSTGAGQTRPAPSLVHNSGKINTVQQGIKIINKIK